MKMVHINKSVSSIVVAVAMLIGQAVLAQRPNVKRPNPNRPNQRSQNSDNNSAESAAAKLAVDSSSVIQGEGALLVSTIEGFWAGRKRGGGVPTPEQFAQYIAAHASVRYQPATCLTSSLNGNTVTLGFNACTGPRGLRRLSGQLIEVVTVDTAGIHVHAIATSLQIGDATMNIDDAATYTNNNGTRSMSVMTTGAGTGPLGNTFVRNGAYTTTWTDTCVVINGSWQSTSGGASRSTQVNNLTQCNGKCPTNGGRITHTYYAGVTITITFDGSAVARWTTTNGKTGTINLVCLPWSA